MVSRCLLLLLVASKQKGGGSYQLGQAGSFMYVLDIFHSKVLIGYLLLCLCVFMHACAKESGWCLYPLGASVAPQEGLKNVLYMEYHLSSWFWGSDNLNREELSSQGESNPRGLAGLLS